MRIRPLGERVILRRAKKKETTPGGIIVPDTASETLCEADVLFSGSGKRVGESTFPMELKVGDRVLFEEHEATEFNLDGEAFLVIDEQHVMAVLE